MAGPPLTFDLQTLELCASDLQDALGKWDKYLTVEKNMSRHTVRAYRHDVSQFLGFLARHKAEQIGLRHLSDAALRDFRAFLSRRAMEGAGNATRARALSGLKNFIGWLDKQGILHNAALKTLRTPKKHRKLPRPLYEKQALDLLMRFDDAEEDWVSLRNKALFTLLYGCGLRIDEALALNVKDWPSHDFLRVMGKGRKERQVPVLPIVKDGVAAYRAACPFAETPGRPLFMGARGKRLNQGVAQKTLRDLRVEAGLPENITPHALRHSFATHMLQNGANLRVIQELLGHASLSSTQIYTELDGKRLMEVHKSAHPRANKELISGDD